MKGLIFAAATVAMVGIAGADVSSGNIVGYMNITKPSKVSIGGSMFYAPGTSEVYLYNIKPVYNGNAPVKSLAKAQTLACLLGTKASVDSDKKYYYYDGDWYYTKNDQVVPKTEKFPAGTAFLVSFANSALAGLQYAGEVNLGSEGKILWTKPSNVGFVANPVPRDIYLSEVSYTMSETIVKSLAKAQTIAFLEADKAVVDTDRKYYYYDGDWYSTKTDAVVDAKKIVLKAGEGVLYTFSNSKVLGLSFPGALTSAPVYE